MVFGVVEVEEDMVGSGGSSNEVLGVIVDELRPDQMEEWRRGDGVDSINISLFLKFGYGDGALGIRVGLVVGDREGVLLVWARFDAVYADVGFATANKAKHWSNQYKAELLIHRMPSISNRVIF